MRRRQVEPGTVVRGRHAYCSDTPRPLADLSTSGDFGAGPAGGHVARRRGQLGRAEPSWERGPNPHSPRRDWTASRLGYRNRTRASAGRERVQVAGEPWALALPDQTTPGEMPVQWLSPFPALESWGVGAAAARRKARPCPPFLFHPSRCSQQVGSGKMVVCVCVCLHACVRTQADGRCLCSCSSVIWDKAGVARLEGA